MFLPSALCDFLWESRPTLLGPLTRPCTGMVCSLLHVCRVDLVKTAECWLWLRFDVQLFRLRRRSAELSVLWYTRRTLRNRGAPRGVGGSCFVRSWPWWACMQLSHMLNLFATELHYFLVTVWEKYEYSCTFIETPLVLLGAFLVCWVFILCICFALLVSPTIWRINSFATAGGWSGDRTCKTRSWGISSK